MRKENILYSRNSSRCSKQLYKKTKSINSFLNGKNKVLLDGVMISRNQRVTICATCAKTMCTNKKHDRRLSISAGFWVDMKNKYNYKIMGRYRLCRFIRKNIKFSGN